MYLLDTLLVLKVTNYLTFPPIQLVSRDFIFHEHIFPQSYVSPSKVYSMPLVQDIFSFPLDSFLSSNSADISLDVPAVSELDLAAPIPDTNHSTDILSFIPHASPAQPEPLIHLNHLPNPTNLFLEDLLDLTQLPHISKITTVTWLQIQLLWFQMKLNPILSPIIFPTPNSHNPIKPLL